jgi:hypothetical protein
MMSMRIIPDELTAENAEDAEIQMILLRALGEPTVKFLTR